MGSLMLRIDFALEGGPRARVACVQSSCLNLKTNMLSSMCFAVVLAQLNEADACVMIWGR